MGLSPLNGCWRNPHAHKLMHRGYYVVEIILLTIEQTLSNYKFTMWKAKPKLLNPNVVVEAPCACGRLGETEGKGKAITNKAVLAFLINCVEVYVELLFCVHVHVPNFSWHATRDGGAKLACHDLVTFLEGA